jgi:hypothetical protein
MYENTAEEVYPVFLLTQKTIFLKEDVACGKNLTEAGHHGTRHAGGTDQRVRNVNI